MCRELSAIGTKEPQYHSVALIMKASVRQSLIGKYVWVIDTIYRAKKNFVQGTERTVA